MNYKIIIPNDTSFEDFSRSSNISAFNPLTLKFINKFSQMILSNKEMQQFPELMAMAFWMRESNLIKLRDRFLQEFATKNFLPRGIAFHIAPSNVDTIFLYSWFISMLVGNKNIVRVSSKINSQMEVIINYLRIISQENEFLEIGKKFLVISYGHEKEITDYFSNICDIRVIWGGDETIKLIRNSSLPAHATELTFANKFSLSLINAESFLKSNEKLQLLENFFNDSYWFNQMACSSPRMIVWVGTEASIASAKNIFWSILEQKIKEKVAAFETFLVMQKLLATSKVLMNSNSIYENNNNNLVTRISIQADFSEFHLHCGSGLFYELDLLKLEELQPIIKRNFQTMTVFGFSNDEIKNILINSNIKGLDRIVKFGDALKFNSVWDGFDLLREFQREIFLDI